MPGKDKSISLTLLLAISLYEFLLGLNTLELVFKAQCNSKPITV